MIGIITGVGGHFGLRVDDGVFERMPVVNYSEITNITGTSATNTSLIRGSSTI